MVTDLETTGLKPEKNHEIIQIARQVIDLRERRVVAGSEVSNYVYAQHWDSRDPEAMAVNRLNLQKLIDEGINLHTALGNWCRGINWRQSVMASWGNDFELKFLEPAFQQTHRIIPYSYKSVDLRSWAFFPLAVAGIEEYPSLGEACVSYGVSFDTELAHDARYDVDRTVALTLSLLGAQARLYDNIVDGDS